jgi:hypothetical protein
VSKYIDWNGGECPVPNGTLVDIKLRGGKVFERQMAWGSTDDDSRPEETYAFDNNAGSAYWHHTGGVFDIVAYRLHGEDQSTSNPKPLDFTQGGDVTNTFAENPASAHLRCNKCGSVIEMKFEYAGMTLTNDPAVEVSGVEDTAMKETVGMPIDELEALKSDAERYRCLRKLKITTLLLEPDAAGAFHLLRLKKLDKAVDAIRNQ